MSEHFGKEILAVDYSHVIVCDLERPQETSQILSTKYQHNELKTAPCTGFNECESSNYKVRSRNRIAGGIWSDYGVMFVQILSSETMKHFNIYRFDATSLKWDRIEWLKLPINHGSINDVQNFDACQAIKIVTAVSPNTLILRSQIRVKTGEEETHYRDYYRVTVG
jgi:hypothetical protein